MTSHLLGPYPEQKDLAHQASWKEKKVNNPGLQGRQEPSTSIMTSQYGLELLLPPRQGGK